MRYIQSYILKDLKSKMVFIGGPRQVGKTTFGKHILHSHYPEGQYFNWDFDEHRQAILKKRWRSDTPLLVFDEIHKYPRWKSWLKGIYDITKQAHSFLITGSARLDVYKKGGDSLVGRYHYWRLHPFTLDEIPSDLSREKAFHRLMNIGGFPEVFIRGDETEARRWRRERWDRVIREDIRDLELVRNIGLLTILSDILKERAGASVVFSNLAEDLQVAPQTIASWIGILEKDVLGFYGISLCKVTAKGHSEAAENIFLRQR